MVGKAYTAQLGLEPGAASGALRPCRLACHWPRCRRLRCAAHPGGAAVGLLANCTTPGDACITRILANPLVSRFHTLQRPLLSPEISTPDLFQAWVTDGSWLIWHF